MYGLYHCYFVNIKDEDLTVQNKDKKNKYVSKHSNRVYKNNVNIRRKRGIKQPGGSSCNQRR